MGSGGRPTSGSSKDGMDKGGKVVQKGRLKKPFLPYLPKTGRKFIIGLGTFFLVLAILMFTDYYASGRGTGLFIGFMQLGFAIGITYGLNAYHRKQRKKYE